MSDDPWLRQPGEPLPWFARFERYRQAGPARTLQGAYEQEQRQQGKPIKHVPGSWKKAAATWRWKTRAAAWDAEQIRLDRERFDQQREADRKERMQIARGVRGIGLQGLASIRPDKDLSPAQVLQYLTYADAVLSRELHDMDYDRRVRAWESRSQQGNQQGMPRITEVIVQLPEHPREAE
jgi:hypothetical protein